MTYGRLLRVFRRRGREGITNVGLDGEDSRSDSEQETGDILPLRRVGDTAEEYGEKREDGLEPDLVCPFSHRTAGE